MPSPPVNVASRRTVRPPPRPRERIPLTAWDLALLPADYLQYGLLFTPPPISTAQLVDHLAAALADALAVYYPVAGRLVTEQHRDDKDLQQVVGCSVSVDFAGQGVEILHAVADGVAIADVVPPDADVPAVVRSFFPLDGAANHEGHELPLFVTLAARSGRAAKYDGRVSLFPGREGGGSVDVEVALAPEHMAALEQDSELWAAVSPDAAKNL